jgi:DNA-binding Xre family transcriptional regulator
MDNKTYGERVRDARKKKGLTQGQLGESIGMLRQGVNYIEKKDGFKFDTMIKICKALEITPNDLAGWK